MKSAHKNFYLAFFTIFSSCHANPTPAANPHASRAEVCAVCRESALHPRSRTHADFYQIDPTAIVSDACASFETLDKLNTALSPSLKQITQDTDFFAYYRLNLYEQKCPVKAWDDETGTCGNIACKVDTLENEKDIPEIWRVQELSKVEGPKAAHPGRQQQKERGNERPLQGDLGEDVGESCVVEYDDECDERDYCVPEDESATAKGEYVSLVQNPERFTGYAGEQVWSAIYQENCFPSAQAASSPQAPSPFQARDDLRSVLQQKMPGNDFALDDECLEKRVFQRIISGMHASINTHICYDYLNQTTGTWGPNLQCYQDRLATHPERISNLYFDYAILLRAVAKLRTYLKSYTFCSGDPAQDLSTKKRMLALADTAAQPPPIFDERTMFVDPSLTPGLKEDFRNRFRNVSRLMDCVGCDKCRLWGKLQTVGYGTALKILFEFDEFKNGENPPLRRTELVALVNTLDRVSHSLSALGKMRDLVQSAQPKPPHSSPGKLLEEEVLEDEEEQEPPWKDEIPLGELIVREFRLVFRTWIYVLKSWIYMPGKIFKISIMELNRLWNYWLGLPVPGRSWEWDWGMGDVRGMMKRDEL